MVIGTAAEPAIALIALIDEIFVYALQSTAVLGNTIRRRVVSILVEDGAVRRKKVAELLADDETISQDDVERLEIALHHHHLPVLDEELFVEYDHRNGDVVLWKDAETAAELLESA
ncbi:DUF7344 domain-containing protein [Natronococcus wangiae]